MTTTVYNHNIRWFRNVQNFMIHCMMATGNWQHSLWQNSRKSWIFAVPSMAIMMFLQWFLSTSWLRNDLEELEWTLWLKELYGIIMFRCMGYGVPSGLWLLVYGCAVHVHDGTFHTAYHSPQSVHYGKHLQFSVDIGAHHLRSPSFPIRSSAGPPALPVDENHRCLAASRSRNGLGLKKKEVRDPKVRVGLLAPQWCFAGLDIPLAMIGNILGCEVGLIAAI